MITQGDTGVTRPYHKEILRTIKHLSSPNVLVLGSGVHFSLESQIFSEIPDAQITSVDYQECTKTVSNLHVFKQVDLSRDTPQLFPTRPFDTIIACEVLEHLSDDTYFWNSLSLYMSASTIALISFPNLASIFCRLELALGLQPHVLESSTLHHTAGMGIGARLNYGSQALLSSPLGHVRGISRKAFREISVRQGFNIQKESGYTNSIGFWPKHFLVGLSGTILITLKRAEIDETD